MLLGNLLALSLIFLICQDLNHFYDSAPWVAVLGLASFALAGLSFFVRSSPPGFGKSGLLWIVAVLIPFTVRLALVTHLPLTTPEARASAKELHGYRLKFAGPRLECRRSDREKIAAALAADARDLP